MYKFELHLHTEETSYCGHVPGAEQARRLKALGYDGFCVTDHLHEGYMSEVSDWQQAVDYHMQGYRAAREEGERLGLKVIFGVEFRFPADERDYLAFGVTEEWLRSHPFPFRCTRQEFFDRYHNDFLIIQAHPFRYYDECFPDCVHGIEICNCNPRHQSDNDKALAFAEQHSGLLRLCGSDVHRDGDEGLSAVFFENLPNDSKELERELRAGRFSLWCPGFAELIEQSAEDLKKPYDSMIIGQICLDTNTDYDGRVERRYGGAVLFSGHAAGAVGHRTAVVPKHNPEDIDAEEAFLDCPAVRVFPRLSEKSTRMENTYFTPDRERRRQVSPTSIDPYRPEDLPEADALIYHLAGLVTGDIDGDMIKACCLRTEALREKGYENAGVALDVQCMLRAVEPDKTLKLYDWAEKKEYLPYIRYLKTDAAEAEMLTGLSDREAAARLMCEWGAGEVMVTHNTEVIVCDGKNIYRAPLMPRNLSGRTGRGDTTFAGYLGERLSHGIQESLNFAAALVSLKMETPGPFTGTRADVIRFAEEVMGLRL